MSEDYKGFKIDKVFISKDRYKIIFQNIMSNKSLVLDALGDCCSDSWFEHTEGVNHLPGNVLMKIEELESVSMPAATRQQVDKVYGFKLHLDDGRDFIIEMRNSSNGYYGGWMSHNLVDGTNVNDDMIPFEEDI